MEADLEAEPPLIEIGVDPPHVGIFSFKKEDVSNPILERPPRISLMGLVELEDDLSDLLGLKVDVAIKKNLRKRIGQRILQEVVPL